MSHRTLVLPCAVEEPRREKHFTSSMEIAAFLCLAEAKRRKKPGIFGAQPENIAFLSKLHYPFWIVPWENESLLVDGLGIVSFILNYKKLPDTDFFIQHVKRNSSTHELFLSTLRIHNETFKDFIASSEFPVEGVMSNKELISSTNEYMKELEMREKVAYNPESLISPKLHETAVLENVKKITSNYEQVQVEMRALQNAITVLNEETKQHEEELQHEIEQIQSFYASEISRIKPEVERKLEDLMTEMNAKIKSVEEAMEKEQEAQLKEKEKLERELERLEQSKSNLHKRLKNNDFRIKEYENKIGEFKAKIQATTRLTEKISEENTNLTGEIKASYETAMERERKKILDLEELRDSEIEKKQETIDELHRETATIVNAIESLLTQKEAHTSVLKEMTVPFKLEQTTLVYVPFYLVEFRAGTKSRYQVFSPVIATSHKGIIKKIQRTFRRSLESRIHMLLRSRSKALEKMLSKTFIKRIKEEISLQRILREKGLSNNILGTQNFKETVKDGIRELESEGWIRPEERDAILKVYVSS